MSDDGAKTPAERIEDLEHVVFGNAGPGLRVRVHKLEWEAAAAVVKADENETAIKEIKGMLTVTPGQKLAFWGTVVAAIIAACASVATAVIVSGAL